jgi:hypothetical protein
MEPMKFYEIGRGQFAKQAQEHFLKAHKLAFESGQKVTLEMKLHVDPPDVQNPNYGNLAWEMAIKTPKQVSIKHITVLSGGYPVSDGTDVSQALQYDLFGKEQGNGNEIDNRE